MRIEVEQIENGYLVTWHLTLSTESRFVKTEEQVIDLVVKKTKEWFEE